MVVAKSMATRTQGFEVFALAKQLSDSPSSVVQLRRWGRVFCSKKRHAPLASQVRPQVFHPHPLILCQPLPHRHGDAPDGFAAVSTCRNALDALAGPLGGKAGRRKGKPKGGIPHFVTFLSANTTSAAVRCLQSSPRPLHA